MVTMGVALLAGLGARIYTSPNEAISMTYKVKRTVKPDVKWQKIYQKPFEKYLKYREALREARDIN
jgi:sugar (pentulose or hexulose) kinase